MGQDNRVTENGVSGVSLNAEEVQNPISATETSSEIPQESGRTKHKRVPRQLADALNGCLCGLVLDHSFLKCKQAGCETQWVSIHKLCGLIYSWNVSSITSSA